MDGGCMALLTNGSMRPSFSSYQNTKQNKNIHALICLSAFIYYVYTSLHHPLSPDITPCSWLGSKPQLTNKLRHPQNSSSAILSAYLANFSIERFIYRLITIHHRSKTQQLQHIEAEETQMKAGHVHMVYIPECSYYSWSACVLELVFRKHKIFLDSSTHCQTLKPDLDLHVC